MTSFVIDLVVTACLLAAPADCSELRTPTLFVSPVQCQLMAQQLLVKIMESYPKRRVSKYVCELRTTGRAI